MKGESVVTAALQPVIAACCLHVIRPWEGGRRADLWGRGHAHSVSRPPRAPPLKAPPTTLLALRSPAHSSPRFPVGPAHHTRNPTAPPTPPSPAPPTQHLALLLAPPTHARPSPAHSTPAFLLAPPTTRPASRSAPPTPHVALAAPPTALFALRSPAHSTPHLPIGPAHPSPVSRSAPPTPCGRRAAGPDPGRAWRPCCGPGPCSPGPPPRGPPQREPPQREPPQSRSVLLDPASGRLSVLDGWHPDAVAWANFTDAIARTGWAFLELGTSDQYNDSLQAYAAGVAEAAVTQELIYMHWMNTAVDYCGPFKYETEYCEKLKGYVEANLAWMQEQMESGEDPEYWHQVHLTLLQLKGLEDSYEGRVSFPTGRLAINPFGFLLFQLSGDLEDLEPALNRSTGSRKRDLGTGSCSALVKLLPGNQELLVAHDTWSSYQNMLRILKKYSLRFRTGPREGSPLVPGHEQAFSSYPGTIFSSDDFYILSSGLVAQETTIGNNNAALWKYVHPQGSVLEWLRNIVANRLATDGATWASVFKRFNSGTYNNQWMIVDYHAFSPGAAVPPAGVLTILEQIPGLVVMADKTVELYQRGYWASYNLPSFEAVFNASGLPALVERYGDWFSYSRTPRALIFQRNQSLVRDLESMVRLMRFNNFEQDPLSRCQACDPPQNAENAISARSDLNPTNGTYPFGALRQRVHGGIDTKVTSSQLAKDFRFVATSGPTWDQVPAFRWSSSPFKGLVHMGQPDLWRFSPVHVRWD
ncbi:putative phospholipase B-like 2 [Tachyglossus aculeatus]|uniref:putative phospholipase B-like 2 n=1 Tax=Tachyglossus aculeatus TaxID=9261 RepID=UPI0018F41BDF|nr:putative phospholipase B-like 2 [Tachyglossus aculeatus]